VGGLPVGGIFFYLGIWGLPAIEIFIFQWYDALVEKTQPQR